MTQPLPLGGFEWVDLEEIGEIFEYPEYHKYGALDETELLEESSPYYQM